MKSIKAVNYFLGLIKRYFFNIRHFDLRYAHWSLGADIFTRLHMRRLADRMSMKRRKYVLHCLDIIKQSSKQEYIPQMEIGEKPKIWMFWWTGVDSAPDIVRISVQSVKENASGFEVHVLDYSNYKKYLTLPSYIVEKHDNGVISHAMFSDILRTTLLSLYGGVWIDATMICLRELPGWLKTVDFYTCKAYDKESMQVSKSRWTSFFLAGSSDFILFSEARDLLFNYWKKYDVQIDYLLIDYVLEYIRLKNPQVRALMERLPDNNLKRNELYSRINEPYSEELLNEFLCDETFIYKCSWRYGKLKEKDQSGKVTLYGFLRERYLR